MSRWVVLAVTLLFAASPVSSASGANGEETIEVISVTVSTQRVDRPPKGVSAGDTVQSKDRLLDTKGAVVGSDSGRFTYTSTHSASYSGEARLPGGTVIVRGVVLVRADGRLMIPIVGGSGKFTGVTGYVTIGPGKTRVVNTYELTLPGASVAAFRAPAAATAKLTIKVTSVSISVKPTDVAPKGASKGDTIEYRDRLLNAKGAVVGSDHGTLTFTSAHSATFAGLAALPGGTVRLAGKVVALTNKSFTIPVTGGTGRFAKARGYVVVGPGAKRALNTYTLTVPKIPVA